jgi:sulfotransferase family protein
MTPPPAAGARSGARREGGEPRILRVAMWSGPRNISTALMRAWGNRADTVVCDEPFYAYYLRETGRPHPGRDEVLAAHESDWKKVVASLLGELPSGKTVFYQKHMAHHLLPAVDRAWLASVEHAFLIRDPGEMLASLIRVTPDPRLEDTGLPQQWEIFELERTRRGRTPPVVDARDVLGDPPGLLRRLCAELNVPFDEAMLAWAPGPRATDGVWARHWYAAVEASTGFEPYRAGPAVLPDRLSGLREICADYYERLHAHRLTV